LKSVSFEAMRVRHATSTSLFVALAVAPLACSRTRATPDRESVPAVASSSVASASASTPHSPIDRAAVEKQMRRQMLGRDRCGEDMPAPPHPTVVRSLTPFVTALDPFYDALDLLADAAYLYLPARVPVEGGLGDTVVVRVPRGGGAIEAVTGALRTRRPYLAKDETHLYVSDEQEVTRYALAAMPKGKPEAVGRIASGNGARALAARDGTVFWSDVEDGALWMRGKAGDPKRIALEREKSYPAGVALDATHAYWADTGGAIRRTPLAGGPIETLATTSKGLEEPHAIAVDAVSLVWLDRSTGALMRVPKLGGVPPVTLATLKPAGERTYAEGTIAIDGRFVYGILREHGIVFRVPMEGGEPQALALGEHLSSFAVDGDRLLWTSCGALVSVAKNAPRRPWPSPDD
jgi:hypothetical protein